MFFYVLYKTHITSFSDDCFHLPAFTCLDLTTETLEQGAKYDRR